MEEIPQTLLNKLGFKPLQLTDEMTAHIHEDYCGTYYNSQKNLMSQTKKI